MPRDPAPRTTRSWRQIVFQYITDHPERPLKTRPLARELGIASKDYPAFRELIRELLRAGALVLGSGRTLALPERTGKVLGEFRAHGRGFGFIVQTDGPDLYVPRGKTRGARDGDTVTARRLPPGRRHSGPRAEVSRIVERAAVHWVGVLEYSGRGWLVRPQGRRRLPPIHVEDPTAKSARPGDMVVVEPLEDTLDSRTVRGVIIEKLGPSSDTQTRILAVIRRHGIPDSFPPDARRAAQRAAARLTPAVFADREDLRDLITITIDPVDARDFDDAISIEPLRNGRVRLGVHIADVSYFVRPDGPLDREAHQRATSAYFPGFVVPMLPEVLSNGVCSLQPGESRLTKSVFLTYDRGGHLVETRFADSVIRSHARLTYREVTAALEGEDVALDDATMQLLQRSERLARQLQRRRVEDGAIVLTLPEIEIRLDDGGNVVDAGPADTAFSHTIIEMFMIAANEAVCRFLSNRNIPLLRRVHPPPEPKSARQFAQMLAGIDRRLPRSLDRAGIQALLQTVRGKPEESAVNYLLLRSLSQAVYSPSDEGHFALALEHYCHFTSPIRRYPDLINHRLLELCLLNDSDSRRRNVSAEVDSQLDLVELGRHTSMAERRAEQAERDAVRLLLLRYMQTKLGETFEGTIVGATSLGVFVQIRPYMAEGLLHVADFGQDNWEFDKIHARFIGRRSGRVVRLGQALTVVVAAVDEFREEITVVPADAGGIGSPRR